MQFFWLLKITFTFYTLQGKTAFKFNSFNYLKNTKVATKMNIMLKVVLGSFQGFRPLI